MDCVYRAYIEHLKFIGQEEDELDYLHYRILKIKTHGYKNQYTFGGVVPWLIRRLSESRNLDLLIYYSFYRASDYHEIARKEYGNYLPQIDLAIEYLAKWGNFVSAIEVPVGIFTMLFDQHAIFSTDLPISGYPIMSISLIGG